MTKQEQLEALKAQVKQLCAELESLKQRQNPRAPSVVVVPGRKRSAAEIRDLSQDERDELVSAIADAHDALDNGRLDQAQEILDSILGEYEEDGQPEEGIELD